MISTHYNTVNMLRTIEEVLGLAPLNLNDAHQPPMADLFDLRQAAWTFKAEASPILRKSGLHIDAARFASGPGIPADMRPTHDQNWWAQRTRGYDWSSEDRIPTVPYNHLLWEGLMGAKPYPGTNGATADND
ncbi:MAG: hypothetical protein WDN04_04390 [Rhodospirillales bacterium]